MKIKIRPIKVKISTLFFVWFLIMIGLVFALTGPHEIPKPIPPVTNYKLTEEDLFYTTPEYLTNSEDIESKNQDKDIKNEYKEEPIE